MGIDTKSNVSVCVIETLDMSRILNFGVSGFVFTRAGEGHRKGMQECSEKYSEESKEEGV